MKKFLYYSLIVIFIFICSIVVVIIAKDKRIGETKKIVSEIAIMYELGKAIGVNVIICEINKNKLPVIKIINENVD